jgi:hypothetical protein
MDDFNSESTSSGLLRLHVEFEDAKKQTSMEHIYFTGDSTDTFFQLRFFEKKSRYLHDNSKFNIFSSFPAEKKLVKVNLFDLIRAKPTESLLAKLEDPLVNPEPCQEYSLTGFSPYIDYYDTLDLDE